MSQLKCVVNGCPNVKPKVQKSVKFYSFPPQIASRFPGARVQRQQWIDAVRQSMLREKDAWTPTPGDVICSAHFTRNYRSRIPHKSNFAPTIFPAVVSRVVEYELHDFVCWWTQDGRKVFKDLNPVIEMEPEINASTNDKPRTVKTFTLFTVDPGGDHTPPAITRSIKISKDLTFEVFLKDKRVQAKSILDEDEAIRKFCNLHEFAHGLKRLKQLNLCQGASAVGVNKNSNVKGKVVKILDSKTGQFQNRLVSDNCDVIVPMKVCKNCQSLWNCVNSSKVSSYKVSSKELLVLSENESFEEKIERLEKNVAVYKIDMERLTAKNKSLTRRVAALKTALNQEQEKQELTAEKCASKRVKLECASLIKQNEIKSNNDYSESCDSEKSSNATHNNCNSSTSNQPAAAKEKSIDEKMDVTSFTEKVPEFEVRRSPAQAQAIVCTPPPVKKVLKITPVQALMLRKMMKTNNPASKVIKVPASQISAVKKILSSNK